MQEPLITILFYHSLLIPEQNHAVVKLNETLQMSEVDFPCSWDHIKIRHKVEEQEKEIVWIKLI